MQYGNLADAPESNFEVDFPNHFILSEGSTTLGGSYVYDWFEVSEGAVLYVQDGQSLTINAVKAKISGIISGVGAGWDGGSGGTGKRRAGSCGTS